MRVHPVHLRHAGSGWQIPVILLLLVVVFSSQLLGSDNDAVSAEEAREVVVVTRNVRAHEELTVELLSLSVRPLSTIPEDVVTDLDEAVGRHARGPIPAGYPLSSYLLSDKRRIDDSAPKKQAKGEDKRRGTEA